MNTITKLLASAALASTAVNASALEMWTTAGPYADSPNITCLTDFDGQACSKVTYSFSSDDNVVGPGSAYNDDGRITAVQPHGSTGNYLAVGTSHGSTVTITVEEGSNYNYFGFLGGSLDYYNFIEFVLTDDTSIRYNGVQISGMDSSIGQMYVNLLLDEGQYFSRIILSSTANSFETDNHAFGYNPTAVGGDQYTKEPDDGGDEGDEGGPRPTALVAEVPAPATLALLGLGVFGLLGMGRVARRRA